MNAKNAIDRVMLDENELDTDDLLRVDPMDGFDKIDKESLIKAAMSRPVNSRRGSDNHRRATAVNAIIRFVDDVGRAMRFRGYNDVTKMVGFDSETGVQVDAGVLSSESMIQAAVNWAITWLKDNGHITPEEVEPLRSQFL